MHMYRPKLEISQTSEETKSWSLNYRFIAVIFIAAAVLLLFVARFVKTSNRSRA
jgi:hypothetical protein